METKNTIYDDICQEINKLNNVNMIIVSDGDKPVYFSSSKEKIIVFLYMHFKEHISRMYIDCFNENGFPLGIGLEFIFNEKTDNLQIVAN